MSNIRPDILTASGHYYDYTKMDNLISGVDIARALSRICRFGGQLRPDVEFYSVAQHSVIVSYLVPHEHALHALFHDAAEAYIGDMMRPLKNLLPDYKAIEKSVEAEVMLALGFPLEMPPCIKIADIIALATEQRDLMAPHDDQWALIDGVEPSPQIIVPLLPNAAYELFFGRYIELSGARSIDFTIQCNEFCQRNVVNITGAVRSRA